MGEPYAIKMVNKVGLKEVAHMSNEKKTLSNQNLPERKTTHERTAKKLNIAFKLAGVALRIISIIDRIIGWLR